LENQRNEEMQMTEVAISTGAASAEPDNSITNDSWSELNWPELKANVLRLQMRIAKAERISTTKIQLG
jgi:hypothetical protein